MSYGKPSEATMNCIQCVVSGERSCGECSGLSGLLVQRSVEDKDIFIVDWDVYRLIKDYLKKNYPEDWERFLKRVHGRLQEKAVLETVPRTAIDDGCYLTVCGDQVLNPKNEEDQVLYFSRFDDALYYSETLKPPVIIAHIEAQVH